MDIIVKYPLPDELLTIEKMVWCIDDVHFGIFVQILERQNAKLSVKLVTTIKERQLQGEWGNLPELIYGSSETKNRQTLNQLASYTFKLSFYLALNYPTYLWGAVSVIQLALNKGEVSKAHFYSEILLDIAEKVEDYSTQKYVFQLQAQEAYLVKEISRGIKYHQQLMGVIETEHLFNEMYFQLRKNFNVNSEKSLSTDIIQTQFEQYKQMRKHKSKAVSLMCSYAVLYIKYYYFPGEFLSAETKDEIKEFEDDFFHHCYLVFPPLLDLLSNVNFLKLNSAFIDLDSQEGKRDYQMMQQHYSKVDFWQNYVNIPEIFSLTVKTSFYLSKYTHRIHTGKTVNVEKDKEDIDAVCKRCSELLGMPMLSDKMFINDHLNLSITYAGLLLLGDKREVKESVGILEDLLFSYQQVNITASLDSIFLCLMLGYFAMQEYEMCAKTFVRYSKLSKGKPVFDENDLCIHILYYMSQWIETGRKQYVNKLMRCKQQAAEQEYLRDARKLLEAFEEGFAIQLTEANAA